MLPFEHLLCASKTDLVTFRYIICNPHNIPKNCHYYLYSIGEENGAQRVRGCIQSIQAGVKLWFERPFSSHWSRPPLPSLPPFLPAFLYSFTQSLFVSSFLRQFEHTRGVRQEQISKHTKQSQGARGLLGRQMAVIQGGIAGGALSEVQRQWRALASRAAHCCFVPGRHPDHMCL